MNYRILNSAEGFCLEGRSPFESIEKLIDYLKENQETSVGLTTPVLREQSEERERDEWEVDRAAFTKLKEIGSGNYGKVD